VRSTTFLFTTLCTSIQNFWENLGQTWPVQHRNFDPAPPALPRATPRRRAPAAPRPRHPRPAPPETARAFPRPPAPRDAWSSAPRYVPLPHSSVTYRGKDRWSVRRRTDARVPEALPSTRWTQAGTRVAYKGPVALASTRRHSQPSPEPPVAPLGAVAVNSGPVGRTVPLRRPHPLARLLSCAY
jgi:hypothetical protein